MIAGVVIVIALLFLGAQFMDPSSSVTLASEFHIPANAEFTSWSVVDRPLRAIIYDVPIGSLLLLAGGGLYWVSDWFNEKLGWRFEAAPPAPANNDQSPPAINDQPAPVIDDQPAPAMSDQRS